MNCIYVCVFNEENLRLFYLLLESIYIYGNLRDGINILVYTTTEIMNKIKTSHLYSNYIIFETNDIDHDILVDDIRMVRFDLYKFQSIESIQKIFYLSPGTLILKSLVSIFDMDIENKFFGDDTSSQHNIVNSDTLLFNNSQTIRDMCMNIRNYQYAYDETQLYDSLMLRDMVTDVSTDNINVHDRKYLVYKFNKNNHPDLIRTVYTFLHEEKMQDISYLIFKCLNIINDILMPTIKESGEELEGNLFMFHHHTQYTNEFIPKQINICSLMLNKNIKHVMEIGFNAGFSALLILLTNPNIVLDCFDLAEHAYTVPCFNILKKIFGDRITLTIGSSLDTLKLVDKQYDIIHIDGSHKIDVAENDILESLRLSKNRTVLIFDDYDGYELHPLWNRYIHSHQLKPLDCTYVRTILHDLRYVSK